MAASRVFESIMRTACEIHGAASGKGRQDSCDGAVGAACGLLADSSSIPPGVGLVDGWSMR